MLSNQVKEITAKQVLHNMFSEASSTEGTVITDEPPSPEDIRENIKIKFLMEMPDDFYDFWEFAKTINERNPSGIFSLSLCMCV